MSEQNADGQPKTHPASREVLPDDPMALNGVEVPGDPDLMLRLLVEEYARMGWDRESVLTLARDPFYQAFHGMYLHFGEEELSRRVGDILARVGVARFTSAEQPPPPSELVQIDPPASL